MKEKLLEVANNILKLSDAESTDITILYGKFLLTRYANSFIHQNTFEESFQVGLRIRYGENIGLAWCDSIENENIYNLVKNAKKFLIKDEFYEPMKKNDYPQYDYSYDESNEEINFEQSASIINKIIKNSNNYKAFGNLQRGVLHILVFSSEGFVGYNKSTINTLTINLMNDNYTTSSWSQYSSYKFRDVIENYEKALEESLRGIELNQNPSEIKPGNYTVILEPYAMLEILDYLSFFALNSKNYYEGTSPFTNKIGQKLFSENLNLYDEPNNINIFTFPFDFEGSSKFRIPVIENGILKNIALNKKYSKLLNLKNTSSAMYPFSQEAFFNHLHIKEGEKTLEEIIKETDYGILVKRFWYVNLVEPTSFTLTGMTRDGLFFIENGKIKKALKNMRFNQSFISSFNEIEDISSDSKIICPSNMYGLFTRGSIIPSIKIKNFHFISRSEF